MGKAPQSRSRNASAPRQDAGRGFDPFLKPPAGSACDAACELVTLPPGDYSASRSGKQARTPAMTSVETRSSWLVASIALVILSISFGAPYVGVVALDAIAGEVGGARSVPALAGSLAWFGAGVGGLLMGGIAERVGV